VTARALTARRQQLEQQRARAQERLADAEARLDRLGWRGRRKQGADLPAEIAFQRTALRLSDEQLAGPAPQPPPAARGHEQEPSGRERRRELEQKCLQTRERARTRAPELERGLELEW
jgi:hypothetical protein